MKLSFGKKKDGPPEKETALPVVEERDKQAPPSVISLIEQVNAESDLPWPNFFRPSMVFGCDRQNVYHYDHAKETPAQKGPKLRRILDTGTALHTMHQNYLANHKDIFFVPEPKLSVRLGGKKAHVRGSCDGLIIRRSDGYRFVIELKTISKDGFDSLRAPKKEHIKQAMIYARLIGVHWIMFVYICKSSSNMKEYAIPAIDSQWDDFVERVTGLMKHVENKTLPMYDRNTCNIQFCNYTGQCRKDGAPVLEKRLRMSNMPLPPGRPLAEGERLVPRSMSEDPSKRVLPSVGRIVHYQSFGTPQGEYKSKPIAAIVTQVVSEETGEVGLAIFNPMGQFFNPSVKFSEEPAQGCWSWPPYVAPKAIAK